MFSAIFANWPLPSPLPGLIKAARMRGRGGVKGQGLGGGAFKNISYHKETGWGPDLKGSLKNTYHQRGRSDAGSKGWLEILFFF